MVQLYLPVAALDGPMLSDGVAPHLLLVHTDPVLFESLRKILETSGCRVTIANSALTALAAYRTPAQAFALVVTDVQLPHMSDWTWPGASWTTTRRRVFCFCTRNRHSTDSPKRSCSSVPIAALAARTVGRGEGGPELPGATQRT